MKLLALCLLLGPLTAQTLTLPKLSEGRPAPGKRVSITPPEY